MAKKENVIAELEAKIKPVLDVNELKKSLKDISNLSVKVGVKLDTKSFNDELNRLVTTNQGNRKNITLGVKLDTKAFNDAIASLPKKTITLGVKLDNKSYNDAVANLVKKTISLGVKADSKSFKESLNKLQNLSVEIGIKVDKKSFTDSIKNINANVPVGVKISTKSFREAVKALPEVKAKIGVKITATDFRKSVKESVDKITSNIKSMPTLSVQADYTALNTVEKKLAIIRALIRQINRMSVNVRGQVGVDSRKPTDPSQVGNKAGILGGSIVDDLTSVIHFWGRSSKGIGSTGEAIADLLSKLNMASGGFGALGVAITGATAVFATLAMGVATVIKGIEIFGSALGEIANLVTTALKPGFELMAQRDTTALTTKAALKTSAEIDGRKVTSEEAAAESTYMFNRALQTAAKTVLNLDDILKAQQGVLPMLLNKGMTPKQAQDVVFGVAGVAKTGRLAPNQVLQETRDLAQGSITARSSQVANILGITNQDLAKFKGDADALYDYLMDKFKEYSAVMEEYAETPVGAIEQLQETWGIAAMTIVDEYGPLIVEMAHTITDSLGQFNEETGNFELSPWLNELAEGLKEIVVYAASCADSIYELIQEIVGGNDPIEVMINFIKDMVGMFTFLIETLLRIVEVFKGVWVVMRVGISIIESATKAAWGFAQALRAIWVATSTGDMNSAFALFKESRDWLNESGQALLNATDLEGNWNDTIQTGWLGKNKKSGYDTFLGSGGGKFTEIVTNALDKAANREIPKGKDYDKMRGTPRNDEDDKARKKAIKDAQKAMKAHIQGLKEELKDHIAKLKETLAQNKIAYDEGFMSIREYFTQKANIEAEEAQARLQEAQAELAEILATPYENADDQKKEIHKLNREIKEYTRQVEKAAKAQEEVARNMQQFTIAQNAVSNFMSRGTSTNVSGYNYTDVSQLGEGADSLAKLAVDLVKRAKELRNVDLDVGKLLGLFFAEVGQGGNSRNWLENKNPAGFTANSSTPSNMVDWGGGRGAGEAGNYERYTDVPYMTMLDHIVNTWLKWYQKELETGVSTATMNAGLQGVFHTANVDRTSTYDAGVAYAQQHGLYNTFQDVANNLNKSASNLLSASGELVGYMPEEQYSRAGMDTRYSVFQDMSSGVETQILGLNQNVKALFNLFAKRYFEKTGEKVLWTSFTGDLRNGGANNPHSASEKGHRYGWKGDLWVDNDRIATEIAQELGLALGDELDHLDLSAWGGVGGTALTTNASAEELHAKLVLANQAIGSLANTGIPEFTSSVQEWTEVLMILKERAPELGALISDVANKTELGHESYVSAQDYLNTYVNLLVENGSRVTGDLKSQLMSEIPKLMTDIKKYKTDPKMLEQVIIQYRNKVRDKTITFAKDIADYNLKVMERDAEYRATDIIAGRKTFRDMFDRYNSYMSDLNNKLGIGKYIDMLENLYVELENNGFTKEAFEVSEYINNLKQRLVNIQKSWIDKIGEYYDRQQNLFDATEGFTSLQREFGNRELKAYKAEANYKAYSIALDDVNKKIEENNKKLKESQELVDKLAKGTKERANAESAVSRALNESSRLDGLKKEYEYQKKINDLQRKQPDYLTDLKNTAKEAFENGLLTFLTDGITEAESLKDALIDMARSFLKEIQQVSAKWMVKSISNMLFKGFNMDDEPEVDADSFDKESKTVTAINTGSQSIVNAVDRVYYALTGYKPSGSVNFGDYSVEGSVVGSKKLNQPYQNSFTLSALQNSQFGVNSGQANNYTFDAKKYTYGSYIEASTGLQSFSENLNNANQVSFPNFTQGLENATTSVGTEGFNASIQAASTTVETSAQSVSSIISGELVTALQMLATSANSAANALNMIGVGSMFGSGSGSATPTHNATGGYISGPGTSTSDSIPAMLSSGEYVIKASSVKKYGSNFLDSVNSGTFSKIKAKPKGYADGGLIGDVVEKGTTRGISDFGKSISNNITNNNNATINVALVRDEQEGMRQLLKSPEGQRIMLDFSRKYARVTSKF